MRILMDDNQVHNDVINKLWQVYGTSRNSSWRVVAQTNRQFAPGSERPLPRRQRRGAVIILGMLALARRSVVSDRVDVLVRIGLGRLGMVRH